MDGSSPQNWPVGRGTPTRRSAAPRRRCWRGRSYPERADLRFHRPAPLGPVSVRADVARDGRRVQLLEGAMLAGGVEVVRARALRVFRASAAGSARDGIAPPPGP